MPQNYFNFLAILHNNDISDTWRRNNTQTIISRRARSLLHPSRTPTIQVLTAAQCTSTGE